MAAKSMKSALALYLQSISQFKLLTKEEELELGRRIKDENDAEARELLINSNLRLVVSVAKPFKNQNTNLEDLIAEGNIGLITAVEKYNYTLGYRFSTCAVPWIKQAIMKSIIDKSRMIRIPAHIIQQFNQEKKVLDELATDGNLYPTDKDIADRMNITVEELYRLHQWKQNSISMETPLGDEDGNTLEDVCADENALSPAEYAEQSLERDLVINMLNTVNDRTRKIIKLRFGIREEGDPEEYGYEHTLEEIGHSLTPSITRERTRQILVEACQKLKIKFDDK